MTTLYIAGPMGTPEHATAARQLHNADFALTDNPAEADGVVTLPTMPAKTVRAWLTQASNDRRMARLGKGAR